MSAYRLLCRPAAMQRKDTMRCGENEGKGGRARILSSLVYILPCHPSTPGLVIHHLSSRIHVWARACRGGKAAPVPCALCLCHCSGISASSLITGRDCGCLWGNRNNKPELIVSRDAQGMSRQSVLAVPSCCRVTQLSSNVVLCGQKCPCWTPVIGLLPVPRLWSRLDLIACSTSFPLRLRLRSGETPERGALEPHLVIRHPGLPTGTSAMYPCPGSSLGPCPSLIDVPVLPYQSSLLKVCRPSNKTVHHMRHCFCTHSGSNFCAIQTKTTSHLPSPQSTAGKTNTQSRCSEEVCAPAIALSSDSPAC